MATVFRKIKKRKQREVPLLLNAASGKAANGFYHIFTGTFHAPRKIKNVPQIAARFEISPQTSQMNIKTYSHHILAFIICFLQIYIFYKEKQNMFIN